MCVFSVPRFFVCLFLSVCQKSKVSVVSRFYNSVEMEEFQVHKEAMMLMEKMN